MMKQYMQGGWGGVCWMHRARISSQSGGRFPQEDSKVRNTVWEGSRMSQLRAGKRHQTLKSVYENNDKEDREGSTLPTTNRNPLQIPLKISFPLQAPRRSYQMQCVYLKDTLFPTSLVHWRWDPPPPPKLLTSCPTLSHLQVGVICLVKRGIQHAQLSFLYPLFSWEQPSPQRKAFCFC